MRTLLVVGCINVYEPPDADWTVLHCDASERGLYNAATGRTQAPEIVADMRRLPLSERSVDRIQAWHVLEHVDQRGGQDAVAEWRRVLVANGVLDVKVPDLQEACAQLDMGALYGDQTVMPDAHLNAHVWGYTEQTLRELLEAARFLVHPLTTIGELHFEARPN